MNEDSWQDYVLIIEETNSRARSSQHLRDNDKLYLNKRISIDLSSCNFKKKNSFDWESSIQDKNLLSIQENSCIDQSEEHCEETTVSDILEELSDKEFQDYFSNKEVEDQSYTEETFSNEEVEDQSHAEETKDNSSNEIAPQIKTDLKEIKFQSYLEVNLVIGARKRKWDSHLKHKNASSLMEVEFLLFTATRNTKQNVILC